MASCIWDYENWLLARFDSRPCSGGIPFGMQRLTNQRWVDHVKADIVYSDFTWQEYEEHVKLGRGDEWFFDEDDRGPDLVSDEERPEGEKSATTENE